jgi:hypothetical protein
MLRVVSAWQFAPNRYAPAGVWETYAFAPCAKHFVTNTYSYSIYMFLIVKSGLCLSAPSYLAQTTAHRRVCCEKLGARRKTRLARGNRGPPSKKSCEIELQRQHFMRINTMTTITTGYTLSSSMLAKSIAFRKSQLYSLQLIESYFEQRMLKPLNVNLVGCMGYDWQAQIAELPDALISSLSRQVIPALEVNRLRPGAAVGIYRDLRYCVGRAQDVVENCQTQGCIIAKVYRQSSSKRPQINAVASAQSLLRDMVWLLNDMHYVAIKCEERTRAQALRASLLELDIEEVTT